jgi:hypothetical protein
VLDRNKAAVALAAVACAAAGAALLSRLSSPAVETSAPGPALAPISSTIVTPLASTSSYTNEQLAKSLQDETGRMGISGIAKPEEPGAPEGNGGFLGEHLGQPGTREQAEGYIRQLQQMRRPYEREKEKSVKLPGEKAGLLGETPKGGSAIDAPAGKD